MQSLLINGACAGFVTISEFVSILCHSCTCFGKAAHIERCESLIEFSRAIQPYIIDTLHGITTPLHYQFTMAEDDEVTIRYKRHCEKLNWKGNLRLIAKDTPTQSLQVSELFGMQYMSEEQITKRFDERIRQHVPLNTVNQVRAEWLAFGSNETMLRALACDECSERRLAFKRADTHLYKWRKSFMIDGALKKVCEYTVAEKAQYDILVNGVKTAKSSLTEHLNDCHAKVASEDFNEFLAMARIQVKEAIIANGVVQTGNEQSGNESEKETNVDLHEEFEKLSSDEDDESRVLNDNQVSERKKKNDLIKRKRAVVQDQVLAEEFGIKDIKLNAHYAAIELDQDGNLEWTLVKPTSQTVDGAVRCRRYAGAGCTKKGLDKWLQTDGPRDQDKFIVYAPSAFLCEVQYCTQGVYRHCVHPSSVQMIDKLCAKQEEKHVEIIYEVEQVIGHRASLEDSHVLELHVKWKGFPIDEATWEPMGNLLNSKSVVQAYMNNTNKHEFLHVNSSVLISTFSGFAGG
jgi:hypothetical protein